MAIQDTPHARIILFGEAERGDFYQGHFCRSLGQLLETYGNPPPLSRGLFYGIQALMYEFELLFFRVKEEGYSYQDYFRGLKLLEQPGITNQTSAVCIPGVGDSTIMNAIRPICIKHHCILIFNEADLYDYLTAKAM
ncbi:MAG: hypothetical protein WC222_06440 [Parachlamydiales bacterium]|jgi:hypothetical protein